MAVRINTDTQVASWDNYAVPLDGATALSAAVIVQTTSSLGAGGFVFNKWNFLSFGQCFTITITSGGEVAFYVFGTGGYRARVTTNTPVSVSSTVRIVCRWDSSGNVMAIAVNGVDCPLAVQDGHNSSVTALNATVSTPIAIGKATLTGPSFIGAYSELGLWNADIGNTAALAITDPVSPDAPVAHATNLFFYVPLCRNSGGFPEPYFVNLIDGLDAQLYTLDPFPAGTSPHPLVVYPDPSPYSAGFCDVAQVVEVEPETAQSFGPLVWVEWGGSDDVIRVWAPVDLPDPSTYYHGYKAPWLLSAGKVVRALSDEQGEYQGQAFDVTVNDTSRDLRTLLGTSDDRRHLLNTRGVMRMISQDDWRAKLVPRTVAIGKLRNYRLH